MLAHEFGKWVENETSALSYVAVLTVCNCQILCALCFMHLVVRIEFIRQFDNEQGHEDSLKVKK